MKYSSISANLSPLMEVVEELESTGFTYDA